MHLYLFIHSFIYLFILGKGNYNMFADYNNLEGKGESWWNYVFE